MNNFNLLEDDRYLDSLANDLDMDFIGEGSTPERAKQRREQKKQDKRNILKCELGLDNEN